MVNANLQKCVKDLAQPLRTTLYEKDTVAEALVILRGKNIDHKVIYFYVVDVNNRLVGVVSTRKLLLAHPQKSLEEIMDRAVIRLQEHQTLKEAMEIFARHSLLALPVVDHDNKILGLVDIEMYIEESFDVADAQHRSDVFQFIGVTLEDEKHISPIRDYRYRMPWIFCNLVGGLSCAVIGFFHALVLDKVVVLAMFIPLVLTLSESVSMQSMTHSLQFLRRPRLSRRFAFLRILWEWRVLILIALTCGFSVGLVSLLWHEGSLSSLVIGLSILLSVFVSATIGFSVPLLLHRFRLDPKVASGPIVLMLADILTTFFYLSLASWWLL